METTQECRAPVSSMRKKIPVESMFLCTTCINFGWNTTKKVAMVVQREAEKSSSFSREKKLRPFLDEELNKPMKVIC